MAAFASGFVSHVFTKTFDLAGSFLVTFFAVAHSRLMSLVVELYVFLHFNDVSGQCSSSKSNNGEQCYQYLFHFYNLRVNFCIKYYKCSTDVKKKLYTTIASSVILHPCRHSPHPSRNGTLRGLQSDLNRQGQASGSQTSRRFLPRPCRLPWLLPGCLRASEPWNREHQARSVRHPASGHRSREARSWRRLPLPGGQPYRHRQ